MTFIHRNNTSSMKFSLFFLILLLSGISLLAQPFASWKGNVLVLDNGLISQELVVGVEATGEGPLIIKKLQLPADPFNYAAPDSKEFSLVMDQKEYDGSSVWHLVSFTTAGDDRRGNGATISLEGREALRGIGLQITYLLYPGLPVIRKRITVSNHTGKEVRLESLEVESLRLNFSYVGSVLYTNYCRQKHLGSYTGNWDDPLVAVHSYDADRGLLIGDEAPGVLKRIDYNLEDNELNAGLTHAHDPYPFRKYIGVGEEWSSPQVFIIPYSRQYDPSHTLNTVLADFERKYMGLRIYETPHRPAIMYNNYVPFRDDYNDTLLMTVAKAAAACGIRQFVIDCGWHTDSASIGKDVSWMDNCGDWIIDRRKFPHGLKPVFDSVRKLGMEPGLWISVGSASTYATVLKQHPEWAVQDREGQGTSLHTDGPTALRTMCLGTGWTAYIKEKILQLVKELGLTYVKLDLSVVTSAYVNDLSRSGCYATGHPGHKDREESFIAIYTALYDLFDDLHKQVPSLYIDCTFEVAGKLQLIDYALCEHAEGDWLTNIEAGYPVGAYRVRDLAWWKCPVMPASSLIIGNLAMDDPDFIEELKTLTGVFPIVLGDPRKLSSGQKGLIREWADWIASMQKKYDYDRYRGDLPGFGEPTERGWDGWSRINTDTQAGGIIGLFRQGSLDASRQVVVQGLRSNGRYQVKLAPGNTVLETMTGRALEEQGFVVKMDRLYESKLFEIALIQH